MMELGLTGTFHTFKILLYNLMHVAVMETKHNTLFSYHEFLAAYQSQHFSFCWKGNVSPFRRVFPMSCYLITLLSVCIYVLFQ